MKACVRLRKEKANKVSCAKAAGGATAISRASPTRAPQAGNSICTRAMPSARISAKCPSSMIIRVQTSDRRRGPPTRRVRHPAHERGQEQRGRAVAARAGALCWPWSFLRLPLRLGFAGRGAPALPDALLFQRLGHFGGHVVLIVLGQHRIGQKTAGGVERTLGDDTLPLAEQIRQDARIANGDGAGLVGDGKFDRAAGAALDAAEGDQAPKANALARSNA